METSSALTELLVMWLACALAMALVRSKKKTPGVGLVFAYLLNTWMLYWVATVLYIMPWYQGGFNAHLVELGFEQSLYGVVAFATGSLVLAPFLINLGLLPRARLLYQTDANLPKAYITTGVVFFFLMSSTLGSLPTARAIIATGQQLVVVGLGLSCWYAWRNRDSRKMAFWLGATLLLPFISIVTGGYLAYGSTAAISVLIFLSGFVRSRSKVVLAGILLGYLGLSVYVSYMRDRDEIRKVVWGGRPLRDRLEKVSETVTTFEWFDPFKEDQLNRIDGRMNQSYLVGAAVSRLSEMGGYARGETLWDALVGLVPRVLWPDKSVTAGSGTVVTQYTGIQFGKDTSVGIGHVMEFYINFGTVGVVIGFLIMGVIVTILDVQAAERLTNGDLHGFVLWYLPGLSLLQVGGSLIEVTSTAAAGWVVAMLANRYLDRFQKRNTQNITVLALPLISGVQPEPRNT